MQTPRTWRWAVVPTMVVVGLLVALSWAWLTFLEPWALAWSPAPRSVLAQWGAALLLWVSRALGAVIVCMLTLVAAPPLAGPALEELVVLQEEVLGVEGQGRLGVLQEMWCGLKAQLLAFAILTPILGLLWGIEWLIPLSVPLVVPIKLTLTSLGLAWNLLDYPLTLRGLGVVERMRLLRMHPGAALGFGSAVALLFWLTCCGIILLPVAVVGATRLIWSLERTHPGLFPSLKRTTKPPTPTQARRRDEDPR